MAFPRCTCLFVCAFSLLLACGDDSRPSSDTGPRVDTTVSDTGRDAPVGCSSDPDCDDGHECTIDMCGVGNVCRYTPLNERCEDGERCSLERGCNSGCIDNSDCDDGDFCNGTDRCIAGDCFFVAEADCNDGNMCTTDTCSTEVNGCVYETAEGCDAGPTGGRDGSMAGPFDPDVHYEGTFLVAGSPPASLGCPPSSYSLNEVTFSVVDGDLRVTGDRFTMTQSPRPTGATFNVTGTDANCQNVSLSGTFENSDVFSSTWMAGPCAGTFGGCGSQTRSLTGQRR